MASLFNKLSFHGTRVALASFLGLGLLTVTSACAVISGGSPTVTTVSVAANDVIFLAGRTDVTIAPPGTAPAGYALQRNSPPGAYMEAFPVQMPAASGASFQFSATGTINIGQNNIFGPDGYNVAYPYLLDQPLGGISGFDGPVGCLVGVFLNGNNPVNGVAPSAPNFVGNTGFSTLSPALGQVFFIGDGLTGFGTGSTQTFFAPAGATRLFLGIPDASNANGPPGGYDDNVPSTALSVTVAATGVPEPTGIVIIGLASAMGLKRRRR